MNTEHVRGRRGRPGRRAIAALAIGTVIVTCMTALATVPAQAAMNLPRPTFTKPAEGFGSVAPFACYPSLRPGTGAFADLVKASSGYSYGGWRPCDATWGVPESQHKTGRAVDVSIDYRRATPDRADGQALLNWLFENGAERLRRLGVVEIIWAGKIWTSASDQSRLTSDIASWRTYTGLGCPNPNDATNCHYDHFHFTLSVAGSDKTSTWWTSQGSAPSTYTRFALGNIDAVGGDDVVLRRGASWYVDAGANGSADRWFDWGLTTDQVYIGNFDGAGGDDILLRRGASWYVDAGANGSADRWFDWGLTTDQVYIGNFDGAGGDDILLRRGASWYVDAGANGSADRWFDWGLTTDQVYIGNIDGAGGDDILLRRGASWYVDAGANGSADRWFDWGLTTDQVYIGNIDGAGGDDILLRRGASWYVDAGANGSADRWFDWGLTTDQVYIGNIDGAGGDDILLRRGASWYVDLGANASADRWFDWGLTTDQVATK